MTFLRPAFCTLARETLFKCKSEPGGLLQAARGCGVESLRQRLPGSVRIRSPFLCLGDPRRRALYFLIPANPLASPQTHSSLQASRNDWNVPKSSRPSVASCFHTCSSFCLACPLPACSSLQKGLKCHFLLNTFASPLPAQSGLPPVGHRCPYSVVL